MGACMFIDASSARRNASLCLDQNDFDKLIFRKGRLTPFVHPCINKIKLAPVLETKCFAEGKHTNVPVVIFTKCRKTKKQPVPKYGFTPICFANCEIVVFNNCTERFIRQWIHPLAFPKVKEIYINTKFEPTKEIFHRNQANNPRWKIVNHRLFFSVAREEECKVMYISQPEYNDTLQKLLMLV